MLLAVVCGDEYIFVDHKHADNDLHDCIQMTTYGTTYLCILPGEFEYYPLIELEYLMIIIDINFHGTDSQ